jgi:GGDEF domain-containing protein
MLVRSRRHAPVSANVPAPFGAASLTDRGLLERWYIRYRLDEEFREARRYGYPLSIVILSPMIVAGDPSASARVRMGALAAKAAARTTDLIGWLEGDDILVVLPHTDRAGAVAAIDRWRTDMYAQMTPVANLKWLASAVEDAGQFMTADDVLTAACNEFRGVD